MKKVISAVLSLVIALSCSSDLAYAVWIDENDAEDIHVEETRVNEEQLDDEYCAIAGFGRILYVPVSVIRKSTIDSTVKNAVTQVEKASAQSLTSGPYVFWLDWDLNPPGLICDSFTYYDSETGEMVRPDNSIGWNYEDVYAQLVKDNAASLATIDPVNAETTNGFDTLPTIQLSSSASYTLSLKSNGTVWAWGANDFGQCGPNYDPEQGVAQIPGLTNIKEVAAGWTFGVALDNDGDVWTWGSNLYGELGDNTTTTRPIPQKVEGLPAIKSISASGMAHGALAVGENGSLWYWGKIGRLSSLQPTSIAVPTSASTNAPVQMKKLVYAYGDYLNCLVGVDTEGTVWEWALADVSNDRLGTPSSVAGNPPVSTDVVAGHNFVALLSNDGCVYTKGKNTYKELGNGTAGASKNYSYVINGNSAKITGIGAINAGCSNLFMFKKNEDGDIIGDGYFTGNNCFEMIGSDPYGQGLKAISFNISGRSDMALASGGMCFTVTAEKGECGETARGYNGHNYLGVPSNIRESAIGVRVNSSPVPKLVMPNSPAIVVSDYNEIPNALKDIKTIDVYREDGAILKVPVSWKTDSPYRVPINGKYITVVESVPDYSKITADMEHNYVIPTASFFTSPLEIESLVQPKEIEIDPAEGEAGLLARLPKTIGIIEASSGAPGLSVPVQWDIGQFNFDAAAGTVQTLTGELILNGGITNPDNLAPTINVTTKKEDSDGLVVRISVLQNVYLTPMVPADAPEDYGLVDSSDIPGTVEVLTAGGTTTEVPVIWDVSDYDPTQVGVQVFDGELQVPAGIELADPTALSAQLEITVLPKTYQVIDAIAMYAPLEVYPGTTFAQMNAQAQGEGLLAYVLAIDLGTDLEVITLCPITFAEEDNPGFTKDVPGDYTLTARLPANFQSLEDPDAVATTTFDVTVLPPLTIVGAETARMDAYQCVPHQELTGIPSQVNVTLENGTVIPVDVEWNWTEYELAKGTAGEHIVSGTLINLPSIAAQPEGAAIIPVMIVNTIAVDYQITGVLSDNFYEADAGLTLEELTAILAPTLTFEITSTTAGIDVVTSYTAAVTLEEEKNPDYTPEVDGYYPLLGTLALPSNIVCPSVAQGDPYELINLFTNPVNVVSVEPAYVLAEEGTPFAQLTGLPTQVIVTLSSTDAEGSNKTITTGVDWGTGEGYTPFPENLTDDSPVTMEVTGALANYPAYVNGAGVEASLFVTMTRVYDLIGISPSRIPETGTMKVNLGSTLESIYEQMENHSVVLTLQNRKGETHTANVTFQLRTEDNASYDPLTLGTHTLAGYLPLPENVKNPNGIGVEIAVQTMKYTISSSKVVRIANVVSGTPFEEIGLPELVTVVRNDGNTDNVPVVWNGSNYNPTKLGSQAIRGTLVTPLPVHLENPNKRQPNAIITVVDPSAKILSLEQITPDVMPFAAPARSVGAVDESIPGFTEHRYLAEILWEDGTTSIQVVSVYVETETA